MLFTVLGVLVLAMAPKLALWFLESSIRSTWSGRRNSCGYAVLVAQSFADVHAS